VSRNIPASARHLTLVFDGNNPWNSSQRSMAETPPAEHPERRAWYNKFCQEMQMNAQS
jgi:hypothetical protein